MPIEPVGVLAELREAQKYIQELEIEKARLEGEIAGLKYRGPFPYGGYWYNGLSGGAITLTGQTSSALASSEASAVEVDWSKLPG